MNRSLMENDLAFIFYYNKAFIFFLTQEPIGFLMINEEAVKSFKAYFEGFWKMAKEKQSAFSRKKLIN